LPARDGLVDYAVGTTALNRSLRGNADMIAIRWLAAAFALALACGEAGAAESYPTRPVTIVVPLAPGGGTDFLARLVAKHLEQRLGKPFLIENKPGASNAIAAVAVAKSEPDGHTLLMGTTTGMAINVTLRKELPYNPASDFVPLAGIAQVPFILMVNPSLPVASVPQFIAYAKERPGLTFGSSGPGSPHHLFMELFKATTGTDMTHVPYRGSLPAVTDLAAGHIQLMFCDYGPAEPMIQAGKVRPLAISTKRRLSSAPQIAPLDEVGLPGFDAAAWQMLVAPAGTPAAVVDKLHAELSEILSLPEVKAAIVKYGFVPMDDASVDELTKFVHGEIARWGQVVQRAGIAGSE
jgi:tripartite-type tricarboxylate transporter receptor subunit TctC